MKLVSESKTFEYETKNIMEIHEEYMKNNDWETIKRVCNIKAQEYAITYTRCEK